MTNGRLKHLSEAILPYVEYMYKTYEQLERLHVKNVRSQLIITLTFK